MVGTQVYLSAAGQVGKAWKAVHGKEGDQAGVICDLTCQIITKYTTVTTLYILCYVTQHLRCYSTL